MSRTAQLLSVTSIVWAGLGQEILFRAFAIPIVEDLTGSAVAAIPVTIDGAKKYVVSGTLDQVDWNAELVQGDLENAVQQLKQEPGEGLYVEGVTLPLALANLGLIDEYEFVVHPMVAGHGPTLFTGLSERLELELVGLQQLRAGAVALRYHPSRATA